MSVVVIGLNHRTAPLALLERMAIGDAELPKALGDLCRRPNVREAAILSTCNRTEVYAVAERFHGAFADVREFFSDLGGLPPEEFADHLYMHYDDAAATHLFSVAAGLDSAVLGESEVLGQVGSAYRRAHDEGAARSALGLLFRHTVETGKRARTETAIGRHTASVSQAAVEMAGSRLEGGLAGRKVLVLGAGTVGEGLAVTLAKAGVAEVAVVNRTQATAEAVAGHVGGKAVPSAELADALVDVDVLLTSTGASSIMVEQAELAPVIAARAGRPLLIVDVAVPRDVDAAVAELPGVTLLDMDDLHAHAALGLANRRREIGRVSEIVVDEVDRFRAASSAREVAPTVAALRDRAEGIRQAELERAGNRLAALDDRQREAVEALTRSIVAKLLHEPTVRLKDAAGSASGERLTEALTELFDLT